MSNVETRKPVEYPLPFNDERFTEIDVDGDIGSGRLLLFMSKDVHEFIRSHSKENEPKEVGGVLLGQYCINSDTRFVIVPTAVACDIGSATPASINFPPEFYQRVEEIHNEEYPGLLRIGPFHSHPGYGVNPSATDRLTILSAFSHPHHVSLIHDPHEDRTGYTCWRDGELQPSSGCFVYRHREPEMLVKELMDLRPT